MLGDIAERYRFRVYAACLMGNHYHVVGSTPDGSLSATMRYLNGVYAQWFNRRHERTGHLFEARFRSIVVQRESYLKRVARYVVLNPVRAGLVEQPDDWEWSTYRSTVGLAPIPDWLNLEWLDWTFGAGTRAEAAHQFAAFACAPADRRIPLETGVLALGDAAFRTEVTRLAKAGRPDRLLPRSGPGLERPELADLLSGLPHRSPALWEAIERAHDEHGYAQGDIARVAGLDPSSISRGLTRHRGRRRRHA
jgi:REP element-mobilizing transposase RayT